MLDGELLVWDTDRGRCSCSLLQRRLTTVEGVVIKMMASPYRAGAQLWTKVRARDTAEFAIGEVTGTLDRPVTLLPVRSGPATSS